MAFVVEVALLTILLLLFFSGIGMIVWSDPSGMFLEKTLGMMKHLYFTYVLLFSFFKYSVLMPLKMASSSVDRKRVDNFENSWLQNDQQSL